MLKLVQYYKEDKLAHAYLISTNNIESCKSVLLDVIKNIFCSGEYVPNCTKCSLCHLIDINNMPSLKIISPDAAFIKKDQVLALRNDFSKESQFSKENIYIILEAEKMNKESANTILKFLEEPEGNVIGFFVTNHIENILPTIQSRCELIYSFFDVDEDTNLSEDELTQLLQIKETYYKELNSNDVSILTNKKYLTQIEKKDIIYIFKMILNDYYDNLKEGINSKSNIYKTKKKIDLIVEFLEKINYNVNVDLLLDSLVIEFEVINNEDM